MPTINRTVNLTKEEVLTLVANGLEKLGYSVAWKDNQPRIYLYDTGCVEVVVNRLPDEKGQ